MDFTSRKSKRLPQISKKAGGKWASPARQRLFHIGWALGLWLGLCLPLSAAPDQEEALELKQEGITAFSEKKLKEAMEKFLEASETLLEDQELQYYLEEASLLHLQAVARCDKSAAAAQAGDLGSAREYLKECREISPYGEHVEKAALAVEKLENKDNPLYGLPPEQKAKLEQVLEKARQLQQDQKYKAAIEQWDQLLAVLPGFQEAITGKKTCLGQLEKARARKEWQAIFDRGVDRFNQKNYIAAKADFKSFLSWKPGDETAGDYLKKCNNQIQQAAEAESQKALAQAAWNTARDFRSRQEFGRARESLYEGKSLAPGLKDWDGEIKAVNLEEREALKKARAEKFNEMNKASQAGISALVQEKLELSVNNLTLAVRLARELDSKEDIRFNEEYLAKAKESIKRLQREQVDEHSPFYPLVQKLFRSGDRKYGKGEVKAAKADFEEIRILFPENQKAIQRVILCDLKLNPDLAREQLAQFVTRGKAMLKEKNYELARRYFRIVAEIEPGYPGIKELVRDSDTRVKTKLVARTISRAQANQIYRRAVRLQRRDPKKALSLLLNLLRQYPGHENAVTLKTRLQGQSGDAPRVAQSRPAPADAVRYYTQGIRYYTGGRYREARVALRKCLRISPGYTKARRALNRVNRILNRG